MSKPRICKSCKWLRHRVEPCCWCARWGRGKNDYYIPAEETLGEYLKRKEKKMGNQNLSNDKLIKALRNNLQSPDSLKRLAADRLENLCRELIDERDRYDRLSDFELAEAAELKVLKQQIRAAEYIVEKHLQEDEIEWLPPVNYWDNISHMNARQEKKGVEKYGQRLEENVTLSTAQRIEHAQEELIDALKYLEHLKAASADKLTANDYQRMAMRTAGEYESEFDKLRNAIYGLNGESGEIIDLLKKHEFQGHDLPDEKLIDECGDVLWYCALLADALGFDLQTVMERNIEKLRKRYPEGFDKARSINREAE